MFKIEDGREQFYQWDLNRKLLVEDSTIKEVHFWNKTGECSLVVEVKDGFAQVPNIILQDNFKINVYGYDGEATKHCATFGVIARSKPADYVYTETEIKRWEDYAEEVIAEVEEYKAEVEAYIDAAKAEIQGELNEIDYMLTGFIYPEINPPTPPVAPPVEPEPLPMPDGESEN